MLATLFLLLLSTGSLAVRLGDEEYSNDVGGVFYVFADLAIHVIDPVALQIIKNITTDQDGNNLSNVGANGGSNRTPRSWNDVVLAEDPSVNKSYLFINEGDVYPGPGNQTHSYITVIDTSSAEIVARVEVNPRPVHIYVVNPTQEVWSHSDTYGTFDIIAVGEPSELNTTVPDTVYIPGHGKLLLDEALFPRSYGTNVHEQWLNAIDLVQQARTGSFDFADSIPSCTGTHSIVYSNISQHAYVECVSGGTFEWNTVSDTLVHFFGNVSGYMTASLGDDWITATEASTNLVTLLQPQGNGIPAKIMYSVVVPGNPQPPVFYSNSTDIYPGILQDYTIFFPSADNTNMANLATGLNVQSAGYESRPGDCAYNNTSANSSVGLTLASTPTGLKTPGCGACAPGFNPFTPSQFNGSLSGVRYVTLPNIASNASHGLEGSATLLSAGAVKPVQAANGSTANQCSFGETYRTAVRGGPFIAMNADIPTPSLYIIDASNAAGPVVYGTVNTNTSPEKIAWVPFTVPVVDTTILGAL
ncbi:hypothetical protein WJX77_011291 [Trebouxia sp. C0004]